MQPCENCGIHCRKWASDDDALAASGAPLSPVGQSDSPLASQTTRFALRDKLHDRGPGWPHRRALVRGVTVKPWRPQLRDAVPADDPPAARLLAISPLNAES